MLTDDPYEKQFNTALTHASKREFFPAIILLTKLTTIRPEWAEPHWYLSKTLFYHMNSSASEIDAIYSEIKRISEMSEKAKDEEFTDYLMSAAYSELAEANLAVINDYPSWMAHELEEYLEFSPNGEHAKNARTLLKRLEKTN